jgi:hypothetical protein
MLMEMTTTIKPCTGVPLGALIAQRPSHNRGVPTKGPYRVIMSTLAY